MDPQLTDKIWNLLLKTAFGPLHCNTTDDTTADQMVIPYGSARHALRSLCGDMDETRHESGTTLTVRNPASSNTGVRKLSLRFNASHRLDGISITWAADGNTFGKVKSWLDRAVRTAKCHRLGYGLACHYELDNAHIELIGNPFSFGMSREVTLSCFLGPDGKMTARFTNLTKSRNAHRIAA